MKVGEGGRKLGSEKRETSKEVFMLEFLINWNEERREEKGG